MTSLNHQPAEVALTDWHIPAHIHPLFHDGGVVYLNTENATWVPANRITGIVALEACGSLEAMDLQWPELEVWQPAPVALQDRVAAMGLIAPGTGLETGRQYPYAAPPEDAFLPDAGNGRMMTQGKPEPMVLPAQVELNAHESIAKALELVGNLKADASFAGLIADIEKVRGPHVVLPTLEQALGIAKIVFQESYGYPNRIACQEHSIATVLLGAMQGYRLRLHLGAGVDPIAYHAWPAIEDQPLCLESDEPIHGRYYSVFAV